MCRAGGPRCNGSRKAAQTAAVRASGGTAVAEPAPSPAKKSTSTVPSREDTDRLAAELPSDRTGWDGKPLSEKDRRFFALRDSGWKGPIDQDGYPATEGVAADVLRRMARDRGENPDW